MMQLAWLNEKTFLIYARPLGTFALALIILLIVRRIVFGRLYRHAKDSANGAYIILETFRVPSILWAFAASVKFGLDMSIVPQKYTGRASTAIEAFILISITMVISSASVRLLLAHGRRRGVDLAFSGLSRTLIQVFFFTIGLLMLLRLYEVNVTPLLTALGVGGLAVALALQDSLANFFAGIHILIEEPIAVNNYIRLSTGEEGIVTDIGWRTTRVRNGNNNVVVIPNIKITSGILINYNLPETRQLVDVAVMVGFDADIDQVRRIALEEASGANGVTPSPEPSVVFNPGLLPTHLQFTVTFGVAEYQDRGNAQSDVRMRIYRRMKREGVPLPSPWLEAKMLAPAE